MPDHPIAQGLHLLADVLRREKEQGRRFVEFSPQAMQRLERLPTALMEASIKRPLAAGRLDSSREEAPLPVTAGKVDSRRSARRKGERGECLSPAAAPNEPVATPQDSARELSEEEVRAELNRIFREIRSSESFSTMGTLRETLVFATGNPMADLMFVGEAPGAEEEKQRKPFVGPAGEKLNGILKAMGLSREEIYLTNIVKFRPRKEDGRFQGSSNRKPNPEEMEASLPFVQREIAIVRPRVIVALGVTAAEGLLQRGGALAQLREQIHDFQGVPVIATYHPSYLLRQERDEDPGKAKEAKRRVWEDMLRVMERAGLPISERQRNFFR